MRFHFILIIILVCLIVSCDVKQNDLNTKQKSDSIDKEPKYVTLDSQELKIKNLYLDTNDPIQKKSYHDRLNEMNQVLNIKDNLTNEDFNKLLSFDIKDFEKIPVTYGTFQEKNSITTYAKSQFTNRKSKSTITYDLFDYGKDGVIPNPEMFEKDYSKKHIAFIKISDNGLKGSLFLDSINHIARSYVKIGNRITIILRADNFNETLNDFNNILNLIDLKQIVNIYKQK